jgi:fructose-bisphosphate aldolase class 1
MLFAKYDIDNNRELDRQELNKLFEDLEGKKTELENEIKKEHNNNGKDGRPQSAMSHVGRMAVTASIPPEEMAKVVRRVDRMEYTLSVIATKIDSVLEGRLIIPTKKGGDKTDEE